MPVDQTIQPIAPIQKGQDVRRDWRTINQVVEAANKSRLVQAPQKRPLDSALLMHPFKLYQLPGFLRSTSDLATDWCKFIVRGGRVNSVSATGTDGETYPDDETWGGPDIAATLATEITVPAGTTQWNVWLKIARDLTTAEVQNAIAPGVGTFVAFDTADGYLQIPIGWIDTSTEQASKQAKVRQILRGDVFLPLAEFNVKDSACADKQMMIFATAMYAP